MQAGAAPHDLHFVRVTDADLPGLGLAAEIAGQDHAAPTERAGEDQALTVGRPGQLTHRRVKAGRDRAMLAGAAIEKNDLEAVGFKRRSPLREISQIAPVRGIARRDVGGGVLCRQVARRTARLAIGVEGLQRNRSLLVPSARSLSRFWT